MKKLIFVIEFLFVISVTFAQHVRDEKIYYNPLLRTDHIIEYRWDHERNDWILLNTIKYNYTYLDGEVRTVTTLNYFTDIPVSKIIYSYTPESILSESIYQNWESGEWINARRDQWFQNDEGLNIETLIQFWQSNTWINSIRYTDYQYNNRQLEQYTYQIWDNGEWLDYFYNKWSYDENSNLILRLSTNLNATPIGKIEYFTDENNLRQNYTVYNWINNTWIENYRRLYEYNQCGQINTVNYQIYKNGNWLNSTKQQYYYSLHMENIIPGQRVPVCHNGHTIYISLNAVDAHLKHGDCLGKCFIEKHINRRDFDDKESIKHTPFTIYPNPASEKITIKFSHDLNNESKRLEITDFYGKLVRSYIITDKSDLTIYKGNLHSGQYYIRLVGKEIYSQVVIFE